MGRKGRGEGTAMRRGEGKALQWGGRPENKATANNFMTVSL